jgi:hypothetical protein
MKLDARTLRIIGRDLQKIEMEDFDLESREDGCVVRGMITPEPEPPSEEQQPRGIKAWWNQLWGVEPEAPPPPEPIEVERLYQPSDIERMEAEEQALRNSENSDADLYSTPEILRVLATYLATKECELLSLSKVSRRLKYDYADSTGIRHSDDRQYSEFYDFAFSLQRHRKK